MGKCYEMREEENIKPEDLEVLDFVVIDYGNSIEKTATVWAREDNLILFHEIDGTEFIFSNEFIRSGKVKIKKIAAD
ncbi:MAG: hypothetical protein LBI03_02970 [Clostridiales bacterium]|jgi:hypothetical protein|nr:hypothetical protein [Clostridiales bacterium]